MCRMSDEILSHRLHIGFNQVERKEGDGNTVIEEWMEVTGLLEVSWHDKKL